MLAELAARIGRWRDAEKLLRRAVEIAPGLTAARANLALVLGRMGRPAEAHGAARRHFRGRAGGDRPSGTSRRRHSAGSAISSEAIALYEQVLERAPEPAAGVAQLRPYAEDRRPAGGRHRRLPQGDRASSPTLGEAWWSLANLKTVKFDEADVAAMEAALQRRRPRRRGPLPPRFRARQGDARRRPDRRGVRPLCRGATRFA